MGADWKGILGGIAPAIATALGGPAAGGAVKFLAQKFLGKPDATEAEVAEAIVGATPEQIEALKKLDQDFVLALADKAVALEQNEAADRANARDLQKSHPSYTPAIITYTVLGLFCAALVLSYYVKVPTENRDVANAMIEVLKLLNVTAFGFWLGSSSSSHAKDAVIGKMAGK